MFRIDLLIGKQSKLLINCLDRSIYLENVTTKTESSKKIEKIEIKKYSYLDFRQWFDNISNDISEVKAVLYLTGNCNLKCPYCFQNGYTKGKIPNLTYQKAKEILNWIKAFAVLNKTQSIQLYLYGGEPTLVPDLIEYIVEYSKRIIKENGLNITGHMYTNAAKLNEKVFLAIKSNFIKYLQITLDGLPNEHNIRRPYINGLGTFRDIVKNIKRIVLETNAKITILSNFDSENIESIKKLYDYLEKEKLSDQLIFTVNPLFRTNYNCNYCGIYEDTDESVFLAWSDLLIEMSRRGLKCNPSPLFDKGPCSYWRYSHFIFDTYGEIYKCIGLPGESKYSIGNVITHPVEKISMLPPYFLTGLVWENEECLKCPYLPLCLGGCRFQALIKHKDINKIYCHKNLIEMCELRTIKELYQGEY